MKSRGIRVWKLPGVLIGFVAAAAGTRPAPAQTVVLRAVGDVMVHVAQLRGAYNASTAAYNFRPSFAPIRDLISRADISLANLETVLAGRDLGGYSDFPKFNSPPEMARALKWAGFNVVTTANNHSMDRGGVGVVRTIRTLDELGLHHTGTFASPQARARPLLLDARGIRFGIVACAQDTNGIAVPQPWLVNRIDLAEIKKDVASARAAGAEFVVAAVHWGEQYRRQPNSQQRAQARALVAAGVDLILGSHPHVVQPIQWVTTGTGAMRRRGLVFYSMGNFLSAQRGRNRHEGIIAHVEVARRRGGVRISRAGFIPTFVARGGRAAYRVLAVQRALRSPRRGYPTDALKAAWRNTAGSLVNKGAGITPHGVRFRDRKSKRQVLA